MRQRIAASLAALAVFALSLGVASVALGFPSEGGLCSSCHSGNSAIVVTATQTANDGTTATYSLTVSNPYADGMTGWGVFDGRTKVASGYGAGTFRVAVGKTFTVYGVAGKKGRGQKSITISPVAPQTPPPAGGDTTAPGVSLTSPTNGATVSGSVLLAATAADSGSGMSRVEFRVDGNLIGTAYPPTFTVVWDATAASPGAHTIEARAYDVAGNSAVSSVSVSVPLTSSSGGDPFTNDFSLGQSLNTAYLEAVASGGGSAALGSGVFTLASPSAPSASVLSFRHAVTKTAASSYAVKFRVTDIADGSSLGMLSMHAGPSRVTISPTRYLDASFVRSGVTNGLQVSRLGTDGVTRYYNWANATWGTAAAKFSLQPNTVYIVKFETNTSGQFRYVVCSQAGTALVNGTSLWASFSSVYNDTANNYWPYVGDAFTDANSGTMELLSVGGQ